MYESLYTQQHFGVTLETKKEGDEEEKKRKKKERKKKVGEGGKKEAERKRTKGKFSLLFFSTVTKGNGTLCYILHKKSSGFSSISVLHHFAEFILELLQYLKYRTPF